MDRLEIKKARLEKYHNIKKFGGLRWVVLQRDSFKCSYCGITERQHDDLHHRELSVHHKDFNCKNNILDNLIVLCDECHLSLHAMYRAELTRGERSAKKEATLSERIKKIEKIEKRNYDILVLRASGMTLQSIGNKYKISRERIRQILKNIGA